MAPCVLVLQEVDVRMNVTNTNGHLNPCVNHGAVMTNIRNLLVLSRNVKDVPNVVAP